MADTTPLTLLVTGAVTITGVVLGAVTNNFLTERTSRRRQAAEQAQQHLTTLRTAYVDFISLVRGVESRLVAARLGETTSAQMVSHCMDIRRDVEVARTKVALLETCESARERCATIARHYQGLVRVLATPEDDFTADLRKVANAGPMVAEFESWLATDRLKVSYVPSLTKPPSPSEAQSQPKPEPPAP